ncbi:MAG: hypothetical protein ACYSX0_14800, partial [Planctomycetota bacterium]
YGDTAVRSSEVPDRILLPPAGRARVAVPVPAGHGRRSFWIWIEPAGSGLIWKKELGWPFLHGAPVLHEVELKDLPPRPLTFHVRGLDMDPRTATVVAGDEIRVQMGR